MEIAAPASAPTSLAAPASAARLPNPATFALACLVLAIVVWLAWLALAPPRIPAPGGEVTAAGWRARMAGHLQALGEPRPIATDANARARNYLLAQLRAVGVDPEVQRATVRRSVVYFFGGRHNTIGVVHNVVARIPGNAPDAARRPALLLTAHYDSGAATLDAARGAGHVAALLETARSLRAAPPANDVVLLFADGDAVGGLGAKGFAEQHPLARRIALSLKFDDGGGPLRLFSAHGVGAAALAGWQRAAPDLPGSSLLAEMARMLPDAPQAGPLAGLDAPLLLFTGGGAAGAAPAPGQLSHLGDAMLRLARAYGAAPLATGVQSGRSYFTLPLAGQVSHPQGVTWALILASCAALALAWRRIQRQDGTTEALQALFGVAFLLLVARIGTWTWREEMMEAGVAGAARPPLALLAVTLCVFIAGLALLRRSVGATATTLGALCWPALALPAVMLVLPGAAWLLAWPLALALAAVLALDSAWGRRLDACARAALLLAGMAPALVMIPPALRDTWLMLAPQRMYMVPMLMALPLLCFAGLALMLRAGPAIAGALALAGAAFCLAVPAANSAPPSSSVAPGAGLERLVYFKDMNTWRAYWLLPPQPLDDWGRALFAGRDEPAVYMEVFGWHSPRQWYAIAPRDDAIAFPECFVLLDHVGKVRLGRFTVRSKNRAPHIELWMSGAKALRSRLDGVTLTDSEGPWRLSLYGMEDRLLHFEIESAADEIFAVTVQERMPGLPRHLLPARPDSLAPVAAHHGTTLSTDILRFY